MAALCLWATFPVDITPGSDAYMIVYIVIIQLPLLVPFFPITISCIISTYKLRKKGPFQATNSTYCKKRYASTTIVIVTLIYIILNFPVCLVILLEVIQNIGTFRFGQKPGYIFQSNMTNIYIRLLLAVYCVGINAAINPLIYFCRFKGFQKFSKSLSSNLSKKLSHSTTNRMASEMENVPRALYRMSHDQGRIEGDQLIDVDELVDADELVDVYELEDVDE